MKRKLGIGLLAGLTLFALSVLPALAAQGTITEVNPSDVTTTPPPVIPDQPNGAHDHAAGKGGDAVEKSDGAAGGANPTGVDPGEGPPDGATESPGAGTTS